MDDNVQKEQNNPLLFYIHDPMCSWCWAFRPVWLEIQQKLKGKLPIAYLAGGLAPDSDELMPSSMQQEIQEYWQIIQTHVPTTVFNFDFWSMNQARRSTYAACRATIAVRRQHAEKEMLYAIQKAYYLEAKNPSDDAVLVRLAEEIGLDVVLFTERLNHPETQQRLLAEIRFGQHLGAQGFPSLVLQQNQQHYVVPIDYNNGNVSLQAIAKKVQGID
jgi:putative protein-disulfide isomerase